jgi:membrane fusion protein (multidrug efflux system)
MQKRDKNSLKVIRFAVLVLTASFVYDSCGPAIGNVDSSPPKQSLPVIAVKQAPATIYREYTAALEGTNEIEIRPQVDGMLARSYVDEGVYVKNGQLLFQIDDRPFKEQLHNAEAELAAAKANLTSAEIDVSRLLPLVRNNVISDVQLKSAQAVREAAEAHVARAEAMKRNAEINLGYTLIKAPVDGYIGRMPFKTGSLVGAGQPEPLTVLSEIKEVYAYFSLSEQDYLEFKNRFPGSTIEEKIRQTPPVELVLADDSVYPLQGKIETLSGQFNSTTGAITFRAVFPNPDRVLRSGNTGKVRIPRLITSALVVPQEATFELQDKILVFALVDSNKVVSTPIAVAASSGNYYLVEKGLKPGERIVYSGLDRLQDGMIIQPVPMSLDSLLQTRPL